MATKIFPSVNDVNGGVAGQGKTLTEANVKTLQAMPYFDRPYVKSGAVCTNGGGLNLNVATGHYMIDGRWVYKDATEVVVLTASQTNRVWLQLTKDGSGNVTGTTWNVQTGTTVPSDAVLVASVVTGAATITTITASNRGIIQPGARVAAAFGGGFTGPGDYSGTQIATVPFDGITALEIELNGSTSNTSATATNSIDFRDGAGGTGTSYGATSINVPVASGAVFPSPCRVIMTAFSVARTLYTRLTASGGTPSFANATLIAKWDV